MTALGYLFDFLDGIFLAIKAITPWLVIILFFRYVEKVMQHSKETKKFHLVFAFIPAIASFAIAEPGTLLDKLGGLSILGKISGGIVAILGIITVFYMACHSETPCEEEAKKLRQENEWLRKDKENLEYWKKYYEALYKRDHPDES